MGDEGRTVCLKTADGQTVELGESLSIGRTPNNNLIVEDDLVSRRHAVVQREANDRCWIADYGSRNGTFVNARRITQPTSLSHGDLISIGPCVLTFIDEERLSDESTAHIFKKTRDRIRAINCWMLLADISNSTGLLHSMPETEMRALTKAWIGDCVALLERHGGSMNTLLGDGFFAYWQEPPDAARQLDDFLSELRELQDMADPEFRCVLHHGPVIHSGGAAYEGCLSGIEVHFAFRLDALAAELRAPRLMSEAAMRLLAMKREAAPLGEYEMKGFEGAYPVYGF